ncbi:polyprenyl synthetase family protein [Erythrobacter sp. HKB08]|uniref:polyprenyl synthetase family protein n=1 Tax=Erythrobacter sp. HKB08 TaxID=2502843 RepID=UPI00100914D6|nr:polyprenyl synthetase family protein [Erythrobacter sp. HKB08]
MDNITAGIVADLGFEPEMDRLRDYLGDWIARSNSELRPLLEWQFDAGSKYFRPLTVFGCHRARVGGEITDQTIRSAAVLEMMHNMTLVIDDILDQSDERRGKPTMHAEFGMLPALMASGFIVADGFTMSAEDPHDIRLFADLVKRLGVAECAQWRLRRQPLGVADWEEIAGEDTGSMFETCACLGTRDEALRRFGRLLGMLYHGCDDVGDVKGLESLGGGGEEDLRDGILTLPAALAIEKESICDLFCKDDPSDEELALISREMRDRLPDAEAHLDQIASDAAWEARTNSDNPEVLLTLIQHTRELSRR